jgi:hypothetical protein
MGRHIEQADRVLLEASIQCIWKSKRLFVVSELHNAAAGSIRIKIAHVKGTEITF